MGERSEDEREARRLAIQFAGQCPSETRIALRALELAGELVREFIDAPSICGEGGPRLIKSDKLFRALS
jgi:hypothetical protein